MDSNIWGEINAFWSTSTSFLLGKINYRASLVAQLIKNPPANAGDSKEAGLTPGSGRSPGEGNGNPLQYSGEFHGQRSLVGYSPQGHGELDMTEHTHPCIYEH